MLLVAAIVDTACEEMAGGVNASYSGHVAVYRFMLLVATIVVTAWPKNCMQRFTHSQQQSIKKRCQINA